MSMSTTEAEAHVSESRTYSGHYQDREKAKRYEQGIYERGGFDDVLWSVEQREMDRLLARFVPDAKSRRALDFACGTGRIVSYLRPRFGDVTGVDISPAMLEQAAAKAPGARLVHADIVERPEDVPGDMDVITSFRFLLWAEPALREACLRALATKLRGPESVMILGLHGNPMSRRAFAIWRDRLFSPGRAKLLRFGMGDMRALADKVGLRIVGATGLGYLPRAVAKRLPRGVFEGVERGLGGRPGLWRFGSNLIVVCARA